MYTKRYFEGAEASGYPSYVRDAGLIRRNFRARARWITSLHPPGPRLLDVGCAYGFFMAEARDAGFDPVGVELSSHCVEVAEGLCGARVVQGDFLETPLDGPYDVVTMFDVLEHMRDPMAVLRRARALLSPGGILVVETGDFETWWARRLGRHWYFLDPPQHLYYFSERGLWDLLRSCGFEDWIKVRRMGRRVSVSNIGFKLLQGLTAGPVKRALTAGIRLDLRGSVYLNFGDGMLVAARV